MNVTAHQEKKKNEKTKTGKRKAEERQPILKMLCGALLQSFRGQHSEKMMGSARGNWDPREGQQPIRPNPTGVGDHTTTLRRLLIGADLTYLGRQASLSQRWLRRHFATSGTLSVLLYVSASCACLRRGIV